MLEFGGGADDLDVFLGVDADALLPFLNTFFTGVVKAAHVPRTLAVAVAVGAFAFAERGELAFAVLLEADLQDLVEEDIVHLPWAAGIIFLHLIFGEPAGGGEFLRRDGDTLAEALAFLNKEAAVVIPDGVEGVVVALPEEVGAEEVSVGIGEGFGDGRVGDGLLIGGLERGGAGDGKGGDLEGVEDFAGARGVEGFREEAVSDLGSDHLNGVEVFEEGDSDFAAPGTDGEAVTGVGDAEVVAVHGAGAALASADGEGAATAEGRLGAGGGGLGRGV